MNPARYDICISVYIYGFEWNLRIYLGSIGLHITMGVLFIQLFLHLSQKLSVLDLIFFSDTNKIYRLMRATVIGNSSIKYAICGIDCGCNQQKVFICDRLYVNYVFHLFWSDTNNYRERNCTNNIGKSRNMWRWWRWY